MTLKRLRMPSLGCSRKRISARRIRRASMLNNSQRLENDVMASEFGRKIQRSTSRYVRLVVEPRRISRQ